MAENIVITAIIDIAEFTVLVIAATHEKALITFSAFIRAFRTVEQFLIVNAQILIAEAQYLAVDTNSPQCIAADAFCFSQAFRLTTQWHGESIALIFGLIIRLSRILRIVRTAWVLWIIRITWILRIVWFTRILRIIRGAWILWIVWILRRTGIRWRLGHVRCGIAVLFRGRV